jgi:hypothetical protein
MRRSPRQHRGRTLNQLREPAPHDPKPIALRRLTVNSHKSPRRQMCLHSRVPPHEHCLRLVAVPSSSAWPSQPGCETQSASSSQTTAPRLASSSAVPPSPPLCSVYLSRWPSTRACVDGAQFDSTNRRARGGRRTEQQIAIRRSVLLRTFEAYASP